MVCRSETVGSIEYRYCPDTLPPMADRMRALMFGRFTDELTGNPVSARLHLLTEVEGVSSQVTADAVAGLVGNPARRFPGLAAGSVALDMTVVCRRFLAQTFTATLGPFNTGMGAPADYPHHFAPANLGDVGLHRAPSVISGRCVLDNGSSTSPLNAATVTLTGLWHRFPAADVDPPTVIEAPNILSLAQGLYRPRSAGVDQLRQRDLVMQAGEEKTLLAATAPGATRLRLSDRVNLAPGQLLAIEPGDPERVEYLEITQVDGASTDTQPATITLAYPLRREHALGGVAVRVVAQAPGASNNLARHGIAGDQTVFLDALAGLADGTVEISGAGSPEYHRASLYQVSADARGFFRLPPVSRVAMLQLRASHGLAPADVNTVFSPDYELAGNRLDFIFA
ncbi:hypothetical protein E4634_01155 [Mangrovimicrobium sediminis]|uniref:Uncharacterized protein n=1 Tax=Mangrovimicrobium sediminis TaxID=2562682 RepID=A0A4Z0MA59_9GAMM|nr:hypothetical protein [Haliea sp. SAOS-164]TGD76185.1 hypothetical protein E4634_01155 [Haliea sp. SAOS-164]